MQKIQFLIYVFLISAQGLIAQNSESSYHQLSFFGGVQNPIEVALLDLNGSGPADDFYIGPSAGISLERVVKRFGLRVSTLYLNNTLKSVDWYQYKGSIHTSYNKAEITLRANSKDHPLQVKLGLGGGILFQRTPSVLIKYDFVTDEGVTEETFPAESTLTFSLCSSLNIDVPISKKWSLISYLTMDGVLYYGEIETAFLINANIGFGYKI